MGVDLREANPFISKCINN